MATKAVIIVLDKGSERIEVMFNPNEYEVSTTAGFLNKNDKVAFLGIGSGLSCTMMGLEW